MNANVETANAGPGSNALALLLALKRIAQAYGAAMQFARCGEPVRATLPDAGARTGIVVRDFCNEIAMQLGLCWADVAGREVVIHFSIESL